MYEDINERLEAATSKAENASGIMHDVANGPEGGYVTTESGQVPTIPEFLKQLDDEINIGVDSILADVTQAKNDTEGFRDETEQFLIQTGNLAQEVSDNKDSTDQSVTTVNSQTQIVIDTAQQVSIDADQVAQDKQDVQDISDTIGRYQGLWPDTGGSAYKGDTYQTQVSGTPTGQYFTALQDTTVDPIDDNVNWRVVISSENFGVQEVTATGSTTPRGLADRFSDEVNVKDFGAKGDDVADDTSSIQEAIDWMAVRGGGSISVPDGMYLIDAATGIDVKNNIEMILSSKATIKAAPNSLGQYEIIRVHDVDGFSISGGRIDGNRAESTATGGEWGMGISVRGSKNITIRDIDVDNCWGDALYIGRTDSSDSTDGLLVSNFNADNNRRQGISVISLKNAVFQHIRVTNTNGTLPAAGIDFEPNSGDEWLHNISVDGLYTENCEGEGVMFSSLNLGWADWDSSEAYVTGRVVRYEGGFYQALKANTASTPTSSSEDWESRPDFDYISDRVSIDLRNHVDRGSKRGVWSLGHETTRNCSGKVVVSNASYHTSNNYNVFIQNNNADGVQFYFNDCEFINDNLDSELPHVRVSNAPSTFSLGGVHLLRPKFKCLGVATYCVYIYANNTNGLPNKNISVLDIVERINTSSEPIQMVAREMVNVNLSDAFGQLKRNASESDSINATALFDSYYVDSSSNVFNLNSFTSGRTISIINEYVSDAILRFPKEGTRIVGLTNENTSSVVIEPQGFIKLYAVSSTELRLVESQNIRGSGKRNTGNLRLTAMTLQSGESAVIATFTDMECGRYTDIVQASITYNHLGKIILSPQIPDNGTIEVWATNTSDSPVTLPGTEYANVIVL